MSFSAVMSNGTLTTRQYCNRYYGIQKAKTQQKANINVFSNYTGSRRGSARRKVRPRKEGKYRPVSLILVPKKVMIYQNGSTKGKSCLINPKAFYDEVTYVEDKEKGLDVVYLVFSKAFDTVYLSQNW